MAAESTILAFITERLQHMIKAPQMWGAYESVELQILQLLEVRAIVLATSAEQLGSQDVQDHYVAYLAARFPGAPPTTLSTLLAHREQEITPILSEFVISECESQDRRLRNAEILRSRNQDEFDKIETMLRKLDPKQPHIFGQRPVRLTDGAAS
jgi:hypothetical protein